MSSAIAGLAGAAATSQVWSGASMRMPPAQKMANLFDKIDTAGSGSISKAQFEQAFQTMNPPAGVKALGADAVFAKLDPNGTGSVSKQDFVTGMTALMSQLRQHHHANAQGASSPQTLAASTQSLNSLGNSTATGSISIKV